MRLSAQAYCSFHWFYFYPLSIYRARRKPYNRAMKTLIVIGYVWPEPDSSAAGMRMMQLLTLYREASYRVIFASPADFSSHAINLDDHGIESVTIQLNCSSFDEWVAKQAPDVVMFDRFMMEEQFGWRVEEQCPSALRILDMEDVHCLRDARHKAIKAGRELHPDDWHSDIAYREIAAILRCDLSLVISEYEMQWLTEHFPISQNQLCYLPFMVDVMTQRTSAGFAERKQFVSIGNFRHAPNWDAVLRLKALWPAIRKQLPQAEMHIYGAYPPPKATQLHDIKSGFLVKGWAENAEAVVSSARVMLAPLRFGAGLKGKLLEAAMLSTPAVTTSIGAEGMYGDLPAPVLVAQTDDDFVELAVRLYRDENLWQELSVRGQPILQQRFSLSEFGGCLLETTEHLLAGLERHRNNHFIGGMLRHHHLRSTRYMSQWIEVKTQLRQREEY